MRALITGGTGFTGYNLARRLCHQGHEVRLLLRDKRKITLTDDFRPDLIEGDIRDITAVRESVRGIDRVFHIAAMYRTAGSPDQEYWDIHVKGTLNLLEASLNHGVKRIVHCSTVGVHGDVESPPANEESPFKPADIYQRTKLEGELKAREFAEKTGLALSVIRPTAIYGPGDLRLLKLFRLASKRMTPVLGDGKIHYHMVHIDDLVQGFILASEKKEAIGEVFIIGGRENLSLNELILLIAEKMSVKQKTIHLPVWPFQLLGSLCENICKPLNMEPPIYRRRVDFFTKSRSFDISKSLNVLGYSPEVSLADGLAMTASWYREKGYLKV